MRDYLELMQEKMSAIDLVDDINYIVNDWCDAMGLESDVFLNETILENRFKTLFRVNDLNEFTERFEKSSFIIPTSVNYIFLYQSKNYDLILRLEEIGSKNLGVSLDCRYIKGGNVENVISFMWETRWKEK